MQSFVMYVHKYSTRYPEHWIALIVKFDADGVHKSIFPVVVGDVCLVEYEES